MNSFLTIKQQIKEFVYKNEVYLKPVLKLVLALMALLMINNKLGYMDKIDNMSVVLIAALMCSFMPYSFIILISALFILLHLYALSLECAIVGLVLFMVLFLLYFRFSPKDTMVMVLMPFCSAIGIPYVIPLTMGILGAPVSAVSVACSLIVTFFVNYVAGIAGELSSMEAADMASKFRTIIDGLLDSKELITFIVVFAVVIIAVYIVKRLPIAYSFTISLGVGAVLLIIMTPIVGGVLHASVSFMKLLIGTIFSLLIAFVIQIFAFTLDYHRTEKVQFEDDDYYYYVKAVPKATAGRTARRRKAKRRPVSEE